MSADYSYLSEDSSLRFDAHVSAPLTQLSRENAFLSEEVGKGFSGSITVAYDSRHRVMNSVNTWFNKTCPRCTAAFCQERGVHPCSDDQINAWCTKNGQLDLNHCLKDFTTDYCGRIPKPKECGETIPDEIMRAILMSGRSRTPFEQDFFWSAGVDLSGDVDRLSVLFGEDPAGDAREFTAWAVEAGAHVTMAWQPILWDVRIGYTGSHKVDGEEAEKCSSATSTNGEETTEKCKKVLQVTGVAGPGQVDLEHSAYVRNGLLIAFIGHRVLRTPPKYIAGLETRLNFENLTQDASDDWYGHLQALLFLSRAWDWGGPRIGIGVDWLFGNQHDLRPIAKLAATF